MGKISRRLVLGGCRTVPGLPVFSMLGGGVPIRSAGRNMVEALRLHVEGPVQPRPVVLLRDIGGDLNQLFLAEMLAQFCKQLIRDVRRGRALAISEAKERLLRGRESLETAVNDGGDLVASEAIFSADGRIDVHSKRTTNPRGRADQ